MFLDRCAYGFIFIHLIIGHIGSCMSLVILEGLFQESKGQVLKANIYAGPSALFHYLRTSFSCQQKLWACFHSLPLIE